MVYGAQLAYCTYKELMLPWKKFELKVKAKEF